MLAKSLINNYLLHPYSLIVFTIFFYGVYRYLIKTKLVICNLLEINELAFKFLDKYRVKNLYFCYIRLILYFLLNIGIFFLIRFSRLETNINLTFVNPYAIFNIKIVLPMLLLTLCLFYYIKMLKEVFFIDIIRLFIYYYHPNKKFYDFVGYMFFNRFYFQHNLYAFSRLIDYITKEKTRRQIKESSLEQYYYYESIFYNYLKDKQLLLFLLISIQQVLHKYVLTYINYINIILRQLPLLLLIILILYDISTKYLYYSYYGAFFFAITRIFYGMNNFFSGIAIGYCDLHEYFYEGLYIKTASKEEYEILKEKVENENYQMNEEEQKLMRMRQKQAMVLELVPEWLNYIMNDLKNERVRKNGDRNGYMCFILPVRRFWFGISMLWSLWYIFYIRTITIYICGHDIKGFTFCSMIIIVIALLWYHTGYNIIRDNGFFINNKAEIYGPRIYHKLFYLCTISITIFALYIFLQVNFFVLMSDTIIINDWIMIHINYSIKEKMGYLHFLLPIVYDKTILLLKESQPHLIQYISLSPLLDYLNKIKLETLFSETTTIAKIHLFSLEIIKEYIQREIFCIYIIDYYLKENDIQERYLSKLILIRSIMDCISNIINLICFCKFFARYIPLWHIVSNPRDPNTINLIKKLILDIYRIYKRRR